MSAPIVSRSGVAMFPPWRRGLVTIVAGATPVSRVAPAGTIERILSFAATVVTSATAGNRRLLFRVLSGTDELMKTSWQPLQAASLTHRYIGFPGAPHDTTMQSDGVNGIFARTPIPETFWVGQDEKVEWFLDAAQAGDTIAVKALVLQQFRRPFTQ